MQRLTQLLALVALGVHCASASTTLTFCSQQNFQGVCQNMNVLDDVCTAVPAAIGAGVLSINFVGPTADCFICEDTTCDGICSASFNSPQPAPIFPDALQNNVRSVICS